MKHLIYLIRHAKTDANILGKYIGITDPPLCEAGIAELDECINSGCYPPVDYVFASPMARCLQTRERIYGTIPYEIIPELAECNFGIFENKSHEQLMNIREYQDWLELGGYSDFPQGDKIEDFRTRCAFGFAKAVEVIMQKEIKESALVVHGGTIMAILAECGPQSAGFSDWRVKNCEGYKLMLETDLWLREQKVLNATKL